MVDLQAPGLHASGVTLPGAPGVVVGHNERIAWGITNLEYDVQDLYVEKLDERTGRYEFRGRVEQARPERDVIRVKGGTPLEDHDWITRHGPLFLSEGGERMTLRWAAAETGPFALPFVRDQPGARLARVSLRAGAPAGAGAELRVRRCGRQYRLPGGGAAAHPARVHRRSARGRRFGRVRVGRLHPVRAIAQHVQSGRTG